MENDVLITEENMYDLQDQDLAGMEATLKALDLEFEGDQVQTQKPISYKICKCGSYIPKNHSAQYRCGLCGCIIYDKTEV